MAQIGLHALLAMAGSKALPRKKWFGLGLVFGSMFPDSDGYLQGFSMLFLGMDGKLSYSLLHRTVTHNLFLPLAIALFLWIGSLIFHKEALRVFGFGVAIGMAVFHILVDVFLWFDGIAIFWPFLSINLWAHVAVPELVFSFLRAANFIFFALFFSCLAHIARNKNTDTEYLPRVRLYSYIHLSLGIVFSVLVMLLPTAVYHLVDGAVLLLFAFPNAFWVSWKMRQTIET